MSMFDKNVEIEIGGYIVTFNHSTFKTSIRRKDGKKIDQNSDKFKKDLAIIKSSKEYIANMNLMRMESARHEKEITEKETERLLEFTKHLLNQDN